MKGRPPLLPLVLAAVLWIIALPAQSTPLQLEPFKDRLFAYPDTLLQGMDGRYRIVDYVELRDINQRDEIAERRVHSRYVSLGIRKVQADLTARTADGGLFRYFAVGNRERPAMIVVYLHGKGGNRKQGVDDFTFGGNFNRLKNLVAGNGGLYLSPDFSGFDDGGKAEIAGLIRHYHAIAANAPVYVACGSMGAMLCHRLAADPGMTRIVSGYILLGAPPDSGLFQTPAFRARTPFLLGHGSADRVYPIGKVEAFFQAFEQRSPGYPVRLVRFETGTHGTPIRMIDWRDTLNWMLSLR